MRTWPHGMVDAVQVHCGKTVLPASRRGELPVDTQWEGARHLHTAGPPGPKSVAATPVPVPGPRARASVFMKGLCQGLVSQGVNLQAMWSSPRMGLHSAANYFAVKAPPLDKGSWESLRLPAQGCQKPSYTKGFWPNESMSSFLEK